MNKRLPHITELNSQLVKDIMNIIETEIANHVIDSYLMQRKDYTYIFMGRGLTYHPGKIHVIADKVKDMLRAAGYKFEVEVKTDYMFTAKITIPERYTN